MRRFVVAVVGAGLLVASIGVPPAVAGNQSTYTGQCWLGAVPESTGLLANPNTWLGTMFASVATASPVAQDVPVQADVTCQVRVNGVPRDSATFSGAAFITGTDTTEFVAVSPPDLIEICTIVDYTGPFDTTPTAGSCVPHTLPPVVHAPAIGMVYAAQTPFGPTFLATGNLANPAWWNCTATGGTTTAYQITCAPVPGTVLDWHCDVLEAMAFSAPGGVVRTSLDCDGGAPEAQTGTVVGPGIAVAPSTSSVVVSAFTCVVDNGSGGAPVGAWFAECGA